MKKYIVLALTVLMVFGLMGGVVGAEDECPAAPAVAGQILKEFNINFRYLPEGELDHPRNYRNYISMVAQTMTNGTAFPAYECDGIWNEDDGYIDKCDEENYYWAVYNYLRALGADLECPLCDVLDPEASGSEFVDNEDRTGTMTLTVLDKCGNGIEGLELADIEVDIQWVGLTDLYTLGSGGYWNIDLDEKDDGDYDITFHRLGSVTYTRLWDVMVLDETIEEGMYVKVSNLVILTMEADPEEGGSAIDVEGEGSYLEGAEVDIKAVAEEGWAFVEWTAPAGSFDDDEAQETTFTMPEEDVTVTANFVEDVDRHCFETELMTSLLPGEEPYNVYGIDEIAEIDIPVNIITVYVKTDDPSFSDEIDLYFELICDWVGFFPDANTPPIPVDFEDGVGSFTVGSHGTGADLLLYSPGFWIFPAIYRDPNDLTSLRFYHEDHEIVEICVEWEE